MDKAGPDWRLECWNRHKARVEALKAARNQPQRVALYTRYTGEGGPFTAREAWLAAFGDKAKNAKA